MAPLTSSHLPPLPHRRPWLRPWSHLITPLKTFSNPRDPFANPHSIAHQLDFSFGHHFRSQVRNLLQTSVNPVSSSHGFFLVVSFGRSSFHLDPVNVSLALLACTGGAFDSLDVQHIHGNVYKFKVCSKAVGVLVRKNSSHVRCTQCFFHLWSGGGPNWLYEERLWYAEQDVEWTTVSYKKGTSSRSIPVNQVYKCIHEHISTHENGLNATPRQYAYPNGC